MKNKNKLKSPKEITSVACVANGKLKRRILFSARIAKLEVGNFLFPRVLHGLLAATIYLFVTQLDWVRVWCSDNVLMRRSSELPGSYGRHASCDQNLPVAMHGVQDLRALS